MIRKNSNFESSKVRALGNLKLVELEFEFGGRSGRARWLRSVLSYATRARASYEKRYEKDNRITEVNC